MRGITMEKIKKLVDWLESRVGHGYIMGGTGQTCTPSYRKARMEQYPGSAAKIRKNCQRLNGSKSTCDGCAWKDKRLYDCAQLTRWACDSVGIKLVSGATSQWKKTKWEAKGEIKTIPDDKIAMVFRQDDSNTMGHVGFYMGDGSVIHARGHDYGVVRTSIYETKWTHWGIPEGLYMDEQEEESILDIVKEIREMLKNGVNV